jgi:hypothetical protein
MEEEEDRVPARAGSVGSPSSAPRRPSSLEASEIGFVPQPFVRWFHPFELARAGVRTVLADMFGAYADRRELQAALHPHESRPAYSYLTDNPDDPGSPARSAIWVDFVADIGDGFNATYSVASLLARKELTVEGPDGRAIKTERGAVLIMGGDEVYPAASRVEYEQRTVGPYRAAFPYEPDVSQAPHLFAIPGNHDWYDGLSAFLRQFTQGRWIGAWKTRQLRSYFVLELPHRVWVWGIDIQLHSDVDGPQLEYFDAAAASLGPGDRVILCTAEPSWVQVASGKREGYRNLAFIESKVLARGAQVAAVLTGDSHHYARYAEKDCARHYITAGGGGAFLHGTHALPFEIALDGFDAAVSPRRQLSRQATFPTPAESLAQVRHLLKFSLKNRAFALLWATLWVLLGWGLFAASVPSVGALDLRTTFVGELARVGPTGASLSNLPYGSVSVVLAVIFAVALALASRRRTQVVNERKQDLVDHRRLLLDLMLWLTLATVPALVVGTAPLETLLGALARSPAAVCLVATVIGGAMVYVSHASRAVRVLVGLAHASLHVLSWLLIATCTASLLVPLAGVDTGPAAGSSLAAAQASGGLVLQLTQLLLVSSWLLVSAALAGMASATVFGVYLWYAGRYLPEQLNDAFSAIGIQDFKNFIRFHIDRDGVTAYPMGVRRVPRTWMPNRESGVSAAFLVPAGDIELTPELIEAPLTLSGPCPACSEGTCTPERQPSARSGAAYQPNTAS